MATTRDERLEKAAFSIAFLEQVADSIYETLRARLKPCEASLLDDLVLIWGAARAARAGKGRVKPSVNEAARRAVKDVRGKVVDLYKVL